MFGSVRISNFVRNRRWWTITTIEQQGNISKRLNVLGPRSIVVDQISVAFVRFSNVPNPSTSSGQSKRRAFRVFYFARERFPAYDKQRSDHFRTPRRPVATFSRVLYSERVYRCPGNLKRDPKQRERRENIRFGRGRVS